ncbi:hypothetical protein D3C71_1916170 [compost metagenome]
MFADESDGVIDRSPSDADVDCRLDDLRNRPADGGVIEGRDLDRPLLRNADVFDLHRSRRRGALPEA